MRKLRVGLVSWAHVHAPGLARTLSTLDQVEFVGSFDDSGTPYEGRTHPTLEGLLGESEAVVIGSANVSHRRCTSSARSRSPRRSPTRRR